MEMDLLIRGIAPAARACRNFGFLALWGMLVAMSSISHGWGEATDEVLNAKHQGYFWGGAGNPNQWVSGENISSNSYNQLYASTQYYCFLADIVYQGQTTTTDSLTQHCIPKMDDRSRISIVPAPANRLIGKIRAFVDPCAPLSYGSASIYIDGLAEWKSYSHKCQVGKIELPVNFGRFSAAANRYLPRDEDTSEFASIGLKTIRNGYSYPEGSEVRDNHGRVMGVTGYGNGFSGWGYIGSAGINEESYELPVYGLYTGQENDLVNIVHSGFPAGTESYSVSLKRYTKEEIETSIGYGHLAYAIRGQNYLVTAGQEELEFYDITPHRDIYSLSPREINGQYAILISYYRNVGGEKTLISDTELYSSAKIGIWFHELSDRYDFGGSSSSLSAMRAVGFGRQFGHLKVGSK